jgi:hypothetical protein
VVRRSPIKGVGVNHYWDETVATAGLHATAFRRAIVFNPAHTPNSGYIISKRRHGPWAALVSTANNMDRTVLGAPSNFAAPAHAVVHRKDQVPLAEKPVGTDRSRVVLYDIEDF